MFAARLTWDIAISLDLNNQAPNGAELDWEIGSLRADDRHGSADLGPASQRRLFQHVPSRRLRSSSTGRRPSFSLADIFLTLPLPP